MGAKDVGTEQLIKDTARRIFFVEGKLHATTQDIADAAGINRPSLHYYYRTKNDLIRQIHQEAKGEMVVKLDAVLGSSLPFREKVQHFVNVFFDYVNSLPYLQSFLIHEINCSLTPEGSVLERATSTPPEVRKFLREIADEMERGTIRRCSPENFMINLFSLISFPIIMKPMYLDFFEHTSEGYNLLMEERKSMIIEMLFNN
jgi:TetR/AcrR family transcriptional regulator